MHQQISFTSFHVMYELNTCNGCILNRKNIYIVSPKWRWQTLDSNYPASSMIVIRYLSFLCLNKCIYIYTWPDVCVFQWIKYEHYIPETSTQSDWRKFHGSSCKSKYQSVKHFLIFLIIPDFSWFGAIHDFFLNFMWKLLISPDFQLYSNLFI